MKVYNATFFFVATVVGFTHSQEVGVSVESTTLRRTKCRKTQSKPTGTVIVGGGFSAGKSMMSSSAKKSMTPSPTSQPSSLPSAMPTPMPTSSMKMMKGPKTTSVTGNKPSF